MIHSWLGTRLATTLKAKAVSVNKREDSACILMIDPRLPDVKDRGVLCLL